MLDTIFGLPLHPLIVHATVVVVPTAALTVAMAALWARFRSWAGLLPVALSVAAVVLTPLSTSSGESLEKRVGHSKLIEEHSHLADMLIWWVVPLALVAALSWWLRRRATTGRVTTAALAVLALALAAGTLVQVVLIGHSGAKSAWGDTVSAPSSSLVLGAVG